MRTLVFAVHCLVSWRISKKPHIMRFNHELPTLLYVYDFLGSYMMEPNSNYVVFFL